MYSFTSILGVLADSILVYYSCIYTSIVGVLTLYEYDNINCNWVRLVVLVYSLLVYSPYT